MEDCARRMGRRKNPDWRALLTYQGSNDVMSNLLQTSMKLPYFHFAFTSKGHFKYYRDVECFKREIDRYELDDSRNKSPKSQALELKDLQIEQRIIESQIKEKACALASHQKDFEHSVNQHE